MRNIESLQLHLQKPHIAAFAVLSTCIRFSFSQTDAPFRTETLLFHTKTHKSVKHGVKFSIFVKTR